MRTNYGITPSGSRNSSYTKSETGSSAESPDSLFIPKHELYRGFLTDSASRGTLHPLGGIPTIMLAQQFDDTYGPAEYRFRVWNTDTGEYSISYYDLAEGNEVMVDIINRRESVERISLTVGEISVSGFDNTGSGYITGDGVTMNTSVTPNPINTCVG